MVLTPSNLCLPCHCLWSSDPASGGGRGGGGGGEEWIASKGGRERLARVQTVRATSQTAAEVLRLS